jgi:hypothetical protein
MLQNSRFSGLRVQAKLFFVQHGLQTPPDDISTPGTSFGVFTVNVHIAVFWVVTPCNVAVGSRAAKSGLGPLSMGGQAKNP